MCCKRGELHWKKWTKVLAWLSTTGISNITRSYFESVLAGILQVLSVLIWRSQTASIPVTGSSKAGSSLMTRKLRVLWWRWLWALRRIAMATVSLSSMTTAGGWLGSLWRRERGCRDARLQKFSFLYIWMNGRLMRGVCVFGGVGGGRGGYRGGLYFLGQPHREEGR